MGPFRGGPPMASKPTNPATLKRVAKTFLPYKSQLALTGLAVLISAILGLAPPFYLKTIINDGLVGMNLGVVTRYTLYGLAATLISTAFALIYSYLSIIVGQRIMRDLRNQLFDHLQGMSLRFFTASRTGEIQSRLTSDIGGVQSVVSDTVANILSNVTTVVSTLVLRGSRILPPQCRWVSSSSAWPRCRGAPRAP